MPRIGGTPSLSPERIRDIIAAEFLDSNTIEWTVDDPNNTISAEVIEDSINDTHIDWGLGTNQVSAVDIPIADAGSFYTGTEVETALQEVGDKWDAMNEPTGFPNRTDSSLSFADAADGGTLTIAPTNGGFSFYQDGLKYTKSSSENIKLADTEGIHYVYYDAGTLTETVNPTFDQEFTIVTLKVLVSIIYWDETNATGIYIGEERHGITMDGDTHANLHFSVGLRWYSGIALNTIDTDQDGSLNAHAQFGVDVGSVADEDLGITSDAITSTTGLPVYWRSGANGDWRKTINNGYSFLISGTRPNWNELTGGAWQQTETGDKDFMLVHVFATTEKDNPIIAIMGQAVYEKKKKAQDGAATEVGNLLLGNLPGPEITPIASVLFECKDGYTNDVNTRIVSTDKNEDYVDWRESNITRTAAGGDHGSLGGLSDDDHTQYILHSLADAANDFLVASGADTFVKKTLAETGAILEADIDHGNLQGLSTGADHSYIDQDVTSGSSPTLAGSNFTTLPSIDELSDADITTDPVAKNDVLKFNGTNFVPVVEGTTFTFSCTAFDDGLTTGILAGSGEWQAAGAITYSATYNNGPPTTSDVKKSINGAAYATIGVMDGAAYTSGDNTDAVNYPTVDQYIRFRLDSDDGTDSDIDYAAALYFYNYIYYGPSTTGSSFSEANVEALTGTISPSYTTSRAINAGVSNYVVWAYPSRYTSIHASGARFNSITMPFTAPETVSLANTAGLTENYKVFASTLTNLGNSTLTLSTSANLIDPLYYGKTTTTSSYSEADVEGLATNEITNDNTQTWDSVTTGASEYMLFAFPLRLGTPTFWVSGFEGGFEAPETVSVTNANGYAEDYYVWRSTNSNLGASIVETK